MIHLNAEMQSKLDIYPKNNQKYTRCLIRKTEIALNGRPEELVRQMFIHYLIKESGLLANKINIKIESNNHDIEIYRRERNHNFKPHQAPLIIVEVKRENTNLPNHYPQIKRYLKNARCNLGILYNYHQIILFTKIVNELDNFEDKHLRNFQDVENLILTEGNDIDSNLVEFEKAENGNFESFTYLVKKYGKYTTNTIVFKLKNQQLKTKGAFFNVQGNKVYYDPCGQFADKQQFFERQHFEKLVSITY
ncbi:type I restriction enzyme HsdR N-terminal domain-containing protein [Chlorogloea sp. CCALA 695]|uniref:type I restriction enzyme HsdR N-terminal domain-containing protein n=1 Tax=Chlorogloea sp. CCALA 695 TaxID=2107693 RepID=UPI000D07F7DD|nr:type I restriction enzyme HsdR N-terminal domain-containing protein [Chlorogloea sp. CCALA 695]PSB31984.1 hypothetical protein C7B70_11590 [Chlorogloea sp. CCALA 695]